jgi:hypothetical protein
MEGVVYLLCAIAALLCGTLLLRSYRRNGVRLLLWSGLCFMALAVENAVLFADLFLVPGTDLSAIRRSAALLGAALMLYGLVWEAK